MSKEQSVQSGKRLVWVTDKDGNQFVCPMNALKNPNQLTEEEKSRCVDAQPPRGLVSGF